MKKFAKMSLVAALAVAGTVASAQPLAEAIKNVDVSGTVAYRYNDYEGQNNAINNATNNYKIGLNLKSKVNDNVTANTRFLVDSRGMSTTLASDGNVDVQLSEVNFAYTGIANTTIIVGKQAIDTSFTVARDAMGDEATGTGIVAATNVGPVTVFGAFFNQTNLQDGGQNDTGLTLDGAQDMYAAGFMASFAGINLDATYADYADTFDAYTVGLSASYNVSDIALSPFARYSSLDLDNNNTDNKLWKVGVAANMGIFGAHLSYGKTDKEGGVVGLDGSSATGMDEHWRVTLSGNADSSVVYAGFDAQVTESINLALNYSNMSDDANANSDESEIYGQVKYDMSKNLYTYVRFGQYDNEATTDKESMGRVHVQYSF